ncbi:MAG: prepilin peptidase [Aphanocapsa lilacina HA4352-LM1]|nr:prepilin peptidase [Aphanocapsa lilacina HA4352-LM1]
MFAIGFWAIVGAAVGSCINVVAHRLPQGISLWWPPSRCPGCLTPLGPLENVPIFGWLWLGGKCRHCRMAIPVRYLLVELGTAGLFGVLARHFQAAFTPTSLVEVACWGFFVAVLLALSLVDLDTLELPGELTAAGIVGGLVFHTFFPVWASGTWASGPPGLVDALYGLLVGIGLFDVISYVGEKAMGKEAMGGADATLAGLIGVWLGWKLLLVSLAFGFGLGAVFGLAGIAAGRLKREEPLPFGPFLALGALGGLLFGESWITSYMTLF